MIIRATVVTNEVDNNELPDKNCNASKTHIVYGIMVTTLDGEFDAVSPYDVKIIGKYSKCTSYILRIFTVNANVTAVITIVVTIAVFREIFLYWFSHYRT